MSTPVTPSNGWAPRPGYRRSAYPAIGASAPSPAEWTPQAASERHQHRIATIVLTTLGGLGLVGMLVFIFITFSAGRSSRLQTAVLLALVPLMIVLAAVWWIGRWEPEPPGLLAAAFLWGAGLATVGSLVITTSASLLVASSTGNRSGTELFSAVVVAPIVEESTKALGVLIVFLLRRRTFSGPVDGIVYACVVAGGFAFAENILYFVRADDYLVATFIMRGLFSPFAHVTFTACTGLAIGMSARRRSPAAWVWMTPIGLVCAITLHAIWNGVIASGNPLVMFVLVSVPVFIVSMGIVAWLRWAERMTMRSRLDDYARAGWFAPAEVQMLTTGKGRRLGRRWAVSRGPQAVHAMAVFQKTAAELAQLRQQAVDGHAQADFSAKESELLDRITLARRTFLGGQ